MPRFPLPPAYDPEPGTPESESLTSICQNCYKQFAKVAAEQVSKLSSICTGCLQNMSPESNRPNTHVSGGPSAEMSVESSNAIRVGASEFEDPSVRVRLEPEWQYLQQRHFQKKMETSEDEYERYEQNNYYSLIFYSISFIICLSISCCLSKRFGGKGQRQLSKRFLEHEL